MAAPTVNAVTSAYGPQGSDLVIAVPSHSPGDLLIWFSHCGGGRNWNHPGSFTIIGSRYSVGVSGSSLSFEAYYRIAGASEPSTYTATKSDAFAAGGSVMYSISGAENPGTIAIVRANAAHGASGTADTPSITPTDDDSLVIRYAGVCRNSAGSVSPPSGYTERVDSRGPTSNEGAIWAGDDEKAAGSTGAESFTYTPTWWTDPAWGHVALAIAPPAGGGSADSRRFLIT